MLEEFVTDAYSGSMLRSIGEVLPKDLREKICSRYEPSLGRKQTSKRRRKLSICTCAGKNPNDWRSKHREPNSLTGFDIPQFLLGVILVEGNPARSPAVTLSKVRCDGTHH
jgi:hypothetical protein